MATSKIKPALTPEEWESELDPFAEPSVLDAAVGKVALSDEWFPRPGHGTHALAALCLNAQPFGFTREMLAFLREKQAQAARGRGGVDAAQYGEIADRIEALLPPPDVAGSTAET